MSTTISKVRRVWNTLVTADDGLCTEKELDALLSIGFSERTGAVTKGTKNFLKNKFVNQNDDFSIEAADFLQGYLLAEGFSRKQLGLPNLNSASLNLFNTLSNSEKLKVFLEPVAYRIDGSDLSESGLSLGDLAGRFSATPIRIVNTIQDATIRQKALDRYDEAKNEGERWGAENNPDVYVIQDDNGEVWGYAIYNHGSYMSGIWDNTTFYDADFSQIESVGYAE